VLFYHICIMLLSACCFYCFGYEYSTHVMIRWKPYTEERVRCFSWKLNTMISVNETYLDDLHLMFWFKFSPFRSFCPNGCMCLVENQIRFIILQWNVDT